MERFNDFTYYVRFHYENAVNIGFSAEAARGKPGDYTPDPAFAARLLRYAKHRLNLVRGGCGMRTVTVDGEKILLGFGEIRVIGPDGTVYAAPDLVIDRVAEGSYAPPAEFVNAVMKGVDPDSEDYRQYELRYRPELFWGASAAALAAAKEVSGYQQTGDTEGLKRFLAPDPRRLNMATQNGTLLNGALLLGQEEMALYLLEAGIRVDLLSGIELLTAVEKGMTAVVQKLMDRNIPIRTDLPRNNPLFWAIAKHQNEAAELLYNTRKDLVTTYNVGPIRDCNILQWSKLSDNTAFMDFLSNPF